MADIKDNIPTNQFNIDTEDSPVGALVEFLDAHLQNFPADFIKRSSKLNQLGEDLISQELELFLRRMRRDESFDFKSQWNYEDSGRKPDFGIIMVEDRNPFDLTKAFFEIEAKKLPTGSKDYVKGKYGGIERFKRNQHGKGLPESAMVGYVQKETCSHWHNEINNWINELIKTSAIVDPFWNEDDLLKHLFDFGKVQKYVSDNKRMSANELTNFLNDSIKLHHYLMELV
jgi:hypothetical protein